MERWPFQVIEEEVAAFNARDIETFLGTFHADAVLEGLSGSNGRLEGHDDMRAHFGGRMAQPGLVVEILSRVRLGTWIVDHEIVHNDERSIEQLAIYQVREGRIAHVNVLMAPEAAS
jgi:hypothetical protein